MQGHNYSDGFGIEIRPFSKPYESWFEIKPAALFSQYDENSDTYIYLGLFYFNLESLLCRIGFILSVFGEVKLR